VESMELQVVWVQEKGILSLFFLIIGNLYVLQIVSHWSLLLASY